MLYIISDFALKPKLARINIMNRRIPMIILLIGVIAGGVFGYSDYFGDAPDVEIMDRFDDKIIYTTDISVDQGPLIEHCRKEGGEFNTCGSACSNDAEVCIAVCAFTCEL